MEQEILADKALKAQLLSLMKIEPGSPEMEAHLAAGYPNILTRAHAVEIIARRKANPADIPFDLNQQALAYLAALDAKPTEALEELTEQLDPEQAAFVKKLADRKPEKPEKAKKAATK